MIYVYQLYICYIICILAIYTIKLVAIVLFITSNPKYYATVNTEIWIINKSWEFWKLAYDVVNFESVFHFFKPNTSRYEQIRAFHFLMLYLLSHT